MNYLYNPATIGIHNPVFQQGIYYNGITPDIVISEVQRLLEITQQKGGYELTSEYFSEISNKIAGIDLRVDQILLQKIYTCCGNVINMLEGNANKLEDQLSDMMRDEYSHSLLGQLRNYNELLINRLEENPKGAGGNIESCSKNDTLKDMVNFFLSSLNTDVTTIKKCTPVDSEYVEAMGRLIILFFPNSIVGRYSNSTLGAFQYRMREFDINDFDYNNIQQAFQALNSIKTEGTPNGLDRYNFFGDRFEINEGVLSEYFQVNRSEFSQKISLIAMKIRGIFRK